MLDLHLIFVRGLDTERPVDEIEYEEQQGEYNQEHFIYLGTKTEYTNR